jgi:hypothetical protein
MGQSPLLHFSISGLTLRLFPSLGLFLIPDLALLS